MKQRDGGIEVFRCLMMFLVVLCHVGGANVFRSEHATLPIVALTYLAVPGFVAISGWYGIRFTWKKWFAVWGITAFYSVASFFVAHLAVDLGWVVKVPSLKISGGWFIGPYLVLMLLAPVLNAGLDALHKTGNSKLLCAWGG